jgi:hypothetical protein
MDTRRPPGEALFHADHAANKIYDGQPRDHHRSKANVRPST